MLSAALFIVVISYVSGQNDTFKKSGEDATFTWYIGPSEIHIVQTNELHGVGSEICRCHEGSSYKWIIRNPKTGHVFDVLNSKPVLQNFTGTASQVWKLKPVEDSKYLIVSLDNKVLDVNGVAEQGTVVTLGTIRGEKGDKKQHWILNSDNTITSAAASNLVLDISQGNLNPGYFIIHPKHGDWNQKFVFERKF